MAAGFYTRVFCLGQDDKPINNMQRKMSVDGKTSRKLKRAVRKGFQVTNEEKEGEVSAAGQF